MKKTIALAAACATALTPIIAAPAFAVLSDTATYEDPTPTGILSTATINLARAECTRLANLHGPNVWIGTLDETSFDDGTYVPGSLDVSGQQTQVGDATGVGTPVPESVQVVGDPYRIGGSVNMFGSAVVIAAHYPNSAYAFTQDATWNAEYTFTCNMAEVIPQDLGEHYWTGPDQADGGREECEETVAHPFDNRGANCPFRVTIPAGTYFRDDEYSSVIQIGETGTVEGYETMGPSIPVVDDEELPGPVQVVVCISPNPSSKKTQDNGWARKNGYNGDNCTTNWYNTGALEGPKDNVNDGSNNIVTIPQT
jgi:hypothetical protein